MSFLSRVTLLLSFMFFAFGAKASEELAQHHLDTLFHHALEQYEAQQGDPSSRMEVTVKSKKMMSWLEKGQVVIDDLTVDPRVSRFKALLLLQKDGKTTDVESVHGRYVSYVRVPVLKKRARARSAISQHNVTWRDVPRHQLRADTVKDISVLLHQQLRRSVSSHKPIRMSDLSPPIAIKKNEGIIVTYHQGPVYLRLVGKALDSGGVGELIRVRNVESNTIIYAKVMGQGVAEIMAHNPAVMAQYGEEKRDVGYF